MSSIFFLTIIAIQIWCAAVMRSTGRCIPSVNVKSSNEEHDMTNTKYQIISNSYFADHAVNLDLSRSTKKMSSPTIFSSMPVFDFKSYRATHMP